MTVYVEVPLILLPIMMAIVAPGTAIPDVFHLDHTLPTSTISNNPHF